MACVTRIILRLPFFVTLYIFDFYIEKTTIRNSQRSRGRAINLTLRKKLLVFFITLFNIVSTNLYAPLSVEFIFASRINM